MEKKGQKPMPSSRIRKVLRGDRDDLRAMKRALAHAPLGPKATLALTHAIISLEGDSAHRPAIRDRA